MIRIARPVLSTELVDRTSELNREIMRASDAVAEARRLWKRAQPRRQLREVLASAAPGISRCMYCGDNQGTDIDHHEPLSRRPGRTFDWLNHLLACSFCNSHGKNNRYPVDSAGQPLLIDPAAEDPADHLMLALSVGEYHSLTRKGEKTIEVLKLNRAVLVEGRQQARRVIGDLALPRWWLACSEDDTRTMAECVLTIKRQPFAEVVAAMLRQSDQPGAEVIFRNRTELLRILRNPSLRAQLGW